MKTRKNRIFLASEADNRACQLLWEPLSLGECEVLRCETTKDLLARTGESQLPQLVLMHTSLGGSRVFDFCRIFKNRFPTVPLVLLSEQVEPGVRHWAMQQGATDLLPIGKEKDRQYLLQRLSSLLTTPPIQTKVTSMMAVASPSVASEVTVAEAVAALNHLSQTASQYLGKLVITNYWQSTREELSGLARILAVFVVEFGREIQFKESRECLTREEAIALQKWVSAFIQRGQQVVQDLPQLLQAHALNPTVLKLH